MNAVIYARFSSDKQTENSIDFQLRADKEYCESKGLRVVGEYIDRAISGTSDQRPEFQRMIRDAKKQQFAFIIVYRFDRFARNRYDSAIYKKELESVGVRVLSTEESVGTGDEGLILESIYEAMAESYSRRLSRVVSQGMRETALKGQSTGGNLPHGYRVEDHMVVIDESFVPAIRYCFEARAEGKRKKPITDELNARGYRTKTGKLFTIHTVTQILANPIYKGVHNYAGIERSCPAIISEELWDRVNELEQRDKKTYGKKTDTIYYALSGKVFCGYCGAAMIGDSGTSKTGNTYAYYTCATKKRHRTCKKKSEKQDFLEWYVCEQTVANVLTDEIIEKIAHGVVEVSEAELGTSRLTELQRELAELDREIDTVAEALIKTSSPALIKRINEKAELLEQKRNALASEVSRLEIDRALQLTERDVRGYLESFRGGDLLDPEYRRRLINTLINCVYIYDNRMVVYYNVKNMKEVSYIDMQDDITDLSSECSDSLINGSPTIKLTEHARLFFKRGGFGFVVSWDNNPDFELSKKRFSLSKSASSLPKKISAAAVSPGTVSLDAFPVPSGARYASAQSDPAPHSDESAAVTESLVPDLSVLSVGSALSFSATPTRDPETDQPDAVPDPTSEDPAPSKSTSHRRAPPVR